MKFSAKQIATYLNGSLIGDESTMVNNFATIETAKKDDLSFLSNPKYTHFLYESQAGIILVNKDFDIEKQTNATIIKVDNAYEALARLLNIVQSQQPKKNGISKSAHIEPTATIGDNVYIAPFVYIGEGAIIADNVTIDASAYIGDKAVVGKNTQIHTGVKITHNCTVGENCILQAGAVIGADGFGFAPKSDGSYEKIPQMGNVIIEDNVEVGANTTIDRATFGSTIIRKGVKLDNLIQIAHNVEIDENTVIAAQTGIAGSTKIGKHCTLAGQVGVAGHIEIADNCIFAAQTGVANSVKKPNSIKQGYPAIDIATFRRATVVYKNLPELQKSIYQLNKEIDTLKKHIETSPSQQKNKE